MQAVKTDFDSCVDLPAWLPRKDASYTGRVVFEGHDEFTTHVKCPHAVDVFVRGHEGMHVLDVPLARRVEIDCSESLCVVLAPNAEEFILDYSSLKRLHLPRAKLVDIRSCYDLLEIIAPRATRLRIRSCGSLTRLECPDVTEGEIILCGDAFPESDEAVLVPHRSPDGAVTWKRREI
ncbi:MAG: hypothetical protein U0929_13540 [Planctomycetaceae bacterium]